MVKLRKTFLFGYSKYSTDRVIQELEKKYEEELVTLQNKIVELEKIIKVYQEKEQFISEALVEAKHTARDVLVDSEFRAHELLETTQENVARRLNFVEEQLKTMENAKQQILDHEAFMRIELRQLFNRHLELLNAIDTTTLQSYGEQVDSLIEESQEILSTTREQLNMPMVQADYVEGVPANVTYLEQNADKGEVKGRLMVEEMTDIPVFIFEAQ